jgi:hypothetical protein
MSACRLNQEANARQGEERFVPHPLLLNICPFFI